MLEPTKPPFALFGRRLRALREQARETIEDVSGAVEIASDDLAKIERGEIRPPEETLGLLINHFDPSDHEAVKLWELAGYRTDEQHDSLQQVASIMLMPMDGRIVYSDMAQVTINNFGVVMNFMQVGGSNKQPVAIARIGMSKEHAKSVLELLQKTLASGGPRLLDGGQAQNKPKQ